MPLSERPTADIVLLIITFVIAFSILLTGAGVFTIALVYPETTSLNTIFLSFGDIIGLLIGTVLGYLAGRGRSAGSQERI